MRKIRSHIFFWFFYFLAAYTIDSLTDPDTTLVKEIVFFTTQNLFLFYGLYYALSKFSSESKLVFVLSIARFVLIICSFIGLRYFIRYYFLATFFQIEYGQFPVRKWFPTCFIWIINSFFYSVAYFYFQSSIQKQKDLLKATEEKATKEKEAAQFEIMGLRAQINPHFMFNTLNYFYNKVGLQQPEVADGIAALSDIMRSAIRKPDADGLIPLEEEISNIEQLISIYRLRYNHSVHISFNQEGSSLGLRILPHILNTLVENGFKHGELHNADHPLTITSTIEDKQLIFELHDKKRTGPKELSHGIGMSYIRTHLSSVYNDRYTLHIDEDNTFYTITLNIDLNRAYSVGTNHNATASIHE